MAIGKWGSRGRAGLACALAAWGVSGGIPARADVIGDFAASEEIAHETQAGKRAAERGDYAVALQHYRRALAEHGRLPGAPPLDAARYRNQIGIVYLRMGRNREALEMLTRAAESAEETEGSNSPVSAAIYGNLGIASDKLGEYEQALRWYGKALPVREKENSAETAETYHGIAREHAALGHHREAVQWYEKALSIQAKVLGDDHLAIASTRHAAAVAYAHLGDYRKALEYLHAAAATFGKAGHGSPSGLASTYRNIAWVYFKQKDYAKAEEWKQKAAAVGG
ncbi:MAG: tetratricopeptide repeat protein [Azoarcus sp.]|jgi:tetratricopeptide (TPR) repeat protein|nr:tetratricopeptide repeat protein [Azoarcus sp.]